VQQVHGIAAQGGFRQAAHPFAIQETIDPFHFAAHGCSMMRNGLRALPASCEWITWKVMRAPPPTGLELLGIAALDEEAVRIVPIG
jgi:hypothetical protein